MIVQATFVHSHIARQKQVVYFTCRVFDFDCMCLCVYRMRSLFSFTMRILLCVCVWDIAASALHFCPHRTGTISVLEARLRQHRISTKRKFLLTKLYVMWLWHACRCVAIQPDNPLCRFQFSIRLLIGVPVIFAITQ